MELIGKGRRSDTGGTESDGVGWPWGLFMYADRLFFIPCSK